MSATSRQEILGRIQAALGTTRPEVPEVPRDYARVDDQAGESRLACFVERVREYKASVRRVAPGELARAIAEACAARGVRRLVVPPDLPADWIPSGVTPLRDPGLTHDQLEESDGVLTACALGIAQTGTIVLDAGAGQGRRVLSLLPDYHLCVIRADQVVGLVPEAVARLRGVGGDSARPLTFISGPSATSDIELERVEGVHGPRSLEVILVDAR